MYHFMTWKKFITNITSEMEQRCMTSQNTRLSSKGFFLKWTSSKFMLLVSCSSLCPWRIKLRSSKKEEKKKGKEEKYGKQLLSEEGRVRNLRLQGEQIKHKDRRGGQEAKCDIWLGPRPCEHQTLSAFATALSWGRAEWFKFAWETNILIFYNTCFSV